ncbi:hypothetical protein FD10_GL001885 [Lactiplantibacillus argentoratensis DSM 16365]|nr:hypothetical protein FD10_GL001885 [Lactiplantibacillus argentoratensis DSM 16365]KZU12883.1 hypothetical protein Nizo2264_1939 [Lactiplantibacillus plantarum]
MRTLVLKSRPLSLTQRLLSPRFVCYQAFIDCIQIHPLFDNFIDITIVAKQSRC